MAQGAEKARVGARADVVGGVGKVVDELQDTVEVLTSGHPEIDPWVGNLAVLRVRSEMDMVLLTESELVKLVRGFADPVAAREL